MKKYLSFVLMLCMLLSVTAPTLVFAEDMNLALGKEVQNAEVNGFNANYCADLTDGVIADAISYDGNWFAFYYNPDKTNEENQAAGANSTDGVASPTVDLGGTYDLSMVRINAFLGNSSGIAAPSAISVEVSDDDETYTKLDEVTFDLPAAGSEDGKKVAWVEFDVDTTARYVRINLTHAITWIFVNEIEIYGTETAGGDVEEPSDEPEAPVFPAVTLPITGIDSANIFDDREICYYPAGDADRVLSSDDYNFRYVYILVCDAEGNIIELGNNLLTTAEEASKGIDFQNDFTVPAGGFAITYYYNFSCTANQPIHDVYTSITGELEEPSRAIYNMTKTVEVEPAYKLACDGVTLLIFDAASEAPDFPEEPEPPVVPDVESLIPGEGADWIKTDVNGASVEVAYDNGTVFFFGSMPDTWPSVYAEYQEPITADVDNDLLSIDFTVEGGATNINFFLDIGDGSSYAYSISNTALMAACPEANVDCVGDLHDGVYSCTISIADLVASFATYTGTAFPAYAIVDGKINFVGINVYSVNGAVIKVHDLSIVHNGAEEPDVPEVPDVPVAGGNLAAGKDYTTSAIFTTDGVQNWPDEGGVTLTDGVKAGADTGYTDAAWVGFNRQSPDYDASEDGFGATVVIDLGAAADLSKVVFTAFGGNVDGINAPYWVNLYASSDNETFAYAGSLAIDPSAAVAGSNEYTVETGATAQYVKVCFYGYGWIFIDEIEVYGVDGGSDTPDVPVIPDEDKTYENTMVEGENGNYSCEVPYGFTWIIDDINGTIGGEDNTICTTQDAYLVCNPNWAITIYAEKQADGTYVALQDAIATPGSAANAGITIGENQIALVVHSSSSNPEAGYANWLGKIVAMSVKKGDILVFDMDAMTVYAPIPGEDEEPEPSVKYGDVNGDGVINSADVARLMRYLADYDYAAGTSSVEIFAGADCNGDGIVDGRDSVRLLQYLADREPPMAG